MIMKNVSKDGQNLYMPISLEEALNVENADELIFTSEEEKLGYQKAAEEKAAAEKAAAERAAEEKAAAERAAAERAAAEKAAAEEAEAETEDEEEIEEEEEEGDAKVYEEDFNIDFSDFNLSDVLDDFVKAASEGVKFVKNILNPETWFTTDDSAEPESKTAKLIKLLPFMSKEDLDEVTEAILQDHEEYRDLNILSIMPFCSKEACDKLFVNALKNGVHEKDLAAMIPFISQETLGVLVDEYVSGKYQHINMDVLYPFLSSKDVKRIFDYIVRKKDE